jgi:hypothetical protein
MTAQERIEWMDRVWPVGEAVARSAMKDIIADLARVEAERDALQADSTKAITVVAGLIAERDEWKAMADRASQALVEHLGELEKAQDDLAALRAKGEKLTEAVQRVAGGYGYDILGTTSLDRDDMMSICLAALEEWRKE